MAQQQDDGGSEADTASIDARLALAHDPTTGPDALYTLASDPSVQIRTVVAARPDAPATALRPLTRDRDRAVRAAVAANPATSVGNLLRLVADADRWVRWAVAGNPACDLSVRRIMARTPDKELRGLLAEQPALEPELSEVLIADPSPEVRERLASHTDDPEVIEALLADRTVRVRKGLAVNVLTSAEQRHALARDSSPDVRSALVRAVELAEADLLELVNDRSVEVRRSLATSTLTPPHIRRALESDSDETVATDAQGFNQRPSARAAARPPRPGHRRFVTGKGRGR